MDDRHSEGQGSGLDPDTEGLRLPAGLELLERLGRSRWATVYRATFEGETIALKAYTDGAADWYRKKVDKNVAVFEMLQNRSFRQQPDLLPYTAKPLRVIGQDGKLSLCFLQEYVDGPTIDELGEREGSIPGYLIRTGENIARSCEEKGIEGIDQFMDKVRFQREGQAWVPRMFDFKHVPTEARKKPARGGSLLSRLGFGARPGEPTGFLRDWVAAQRRYA